MAELPRESLARSVAILEDDDTIRRAFVELIEAEPYFSLAGEAATLKQAAPFLQDPPDILLVDLMLPDGAAFDLIETLNAGGKTRIIVISVLGDERAVVAAFRAGACGYLLKGATGFELREAILQTLSGNAPISPSVARFLIKEFSGNSDQEDAVQASGLSPRERDVLHCLATGATDKETARRLGVSPYTVADHMRSVFRKLQVNTRAAAVARAMQAGDITLDLSGDSV